jgi:2-polyprenyl-6-methoxyphenol hydroxylase-like FAD-dependent oxidoreductase
MAPRQTTTQVGIVGGGPAGLMLSHLLARDGIDSVVVDNRRYAEIEQTVRAGILERDSVRLLVETGVSDRVVREGDEHEAIELAFAGGGHRIDFADLVGASVWLYPQTSVFADLAAARTTAGAEVRFGVRDVSVADVTGDAPVIRFTDDRGVAQEVRCRYLVGADGSRSMCRHEIPRPTGGSFSGSTPSPGSASSARRPGARRS